MAKFKTINAAGVCLQVIFLSIATNSLMPFQCYTHPGPARKKSIKNYPDVLCGSDQHGSLVGVGVFCILIVVVLLAFMIYLVVQAPKKTAVDRTYLQKFKFLFFRFRSDRFYYNIIFISRNFLVACVTIMAPDNPLGQSTAMMLVLTIGTVVHWTLWPWAMESINWLDGVTLMTLLIVGAVSIVYIAKGMVDSELGFRTIMAMLIIQFVGIGVIVGETLIQLLKSIINKDVQKFGAPMSTKLTQKMDKMAADWIKVANVMSNMDEATHADLFTKLPGYDCRHIENSLALFRCVYGLSDVQSTATARITLSIPTNAGARRKSFEAIKNAEVTAAS